MGVIIHGGVARTNWSD